MIQGLLLFDVSAMVSMIVLADLSRRLGEALKVPPYYRLLYAATALVFAEFSIDAFRESLQSPLLELLAAALRCAGGIAAFATCLPYWKWLFGEFFTLKR